MILDHKIPKFVHLLIDTHPKALNNFVELIVRTADIEHTIKLVNKKITDTKSTITILKSVAKPENSKNISIILSELKVP